MKITLALALIGGAALLAGPVQAVEPDVDSPAGPELPAPRTDRPDFELDDQTGARLSPEGDPVIVGPEPEVIVEGPPVIERELPNPEMEDLSPTR